MRHQHPARRGRHARRLSAGERLESRRLLAAAPWVIGGDRNPQALDDVIVVEPHATRPAWIQVTVNGAVVGARPAGGRGESRFTAAGATTRSASRFPA